MAYAPEPEELEAEVVIAAPLPYVQRRRRFLRAGRVLVTAGWLVLTHATASNGGENSGNALVGLAFLLLGVSLIALSPTANRFPRAAPARAGAAVADAVLLYLFAPPAGN